MGNKAPCNESEMPCSAHKNFAYAVKWIIGIIIIAGGVAYGVLSEKADDAIEVANKAKDEASNVAVVQNELSHLRDAVSSMGDKLDTKLEQFNEMRIGMERVSGDVRMILEKVNNLERAE